MIDMQELLHVDESETVEFLKALQADR